MLVREPKSPSSVRLTSLLRTQVGTGLLVAAALIGGLLLWAHEGRFALVLLWAGAAASALLVYCFPIIATVIVAFIVASNVVAYMPHSTAPVLVVGLAAVVARKLLQRDLSFRITAFLKWTFLFFAWEVVSAAWAPSYDQFAVSTILRNVLIILLVTWSLKKPWHYIAVILAAGIGVVFSTGSAAHEMITFFRFGATQAGSEVFREVEKARFFGGWTGPNIMGHSAVPFVLLAYAVVRTKVRFLWRLCTALVIVTGTAGVLLSLSRGAMLSMALALLLLLFADKHRWKLLAGIAIAITLVLTFTPLDIFERMRSLGTGDSSISQRAEMVAAGVEMAARYLPFGVGLGNVGTYSPDYSPSLRHGLVLHNAYLDVLVETGVVGIVLFFGALASVLPQIRVSKWQLQTERLDVNLTVCMACAYLSVLVSNAVGSYSNYGLPWFLLALISVRKSVFAEHHDTSGVALTDAVERS